MLYRLLKVLEEVGWILALGILLTLRQSLTMWVNVVLVILAVLSIISSSLTLIQRFRRRR